MAVAVAVDSKAGSLDAGRSNNVDLATGYVSALSYNNTPAFTRRLGSEKKLTLLTSTKSLGHASSTSDSQASSNPNKKNRARPGLGHIDTNMTSYNSTRSESRLAKLHNRTSSGASLPATPSPLSSTHPQLTTPYTTYDASHSSISSTPSTSTGFKSRPYIRKLSSARDDEHQGRLDLSKSTSENNKFPGLGIQDYSARSASEVTFSHTSRRAAHTRTTSGGSQVSVGSRSFTPTQPFMHPMYKTPSAPYTPSGQSYASSMNEDEAHESSDVVTEDDILVGPTFRNRRSVSISSTPQIQPTPLSQSYTAADLGYIPKLTNTSQSNLSIQSGRSGKSSKSRLGRSRRNTERSEFTPQSTRTSVDKALSLVSRRSDTEPQTRDERIREKRRQFNEREASKNRKVEREQLKRRETEETKPTGDGRPRQNSDALQVGSPRKSKPMPKITSIRKAKKNPEKRSDEFRSRSYDESRPAHLTALPRHGQEARISEKPPRSEKDPNASSGTWPRFSTWLQTRLLSCGGKD